MSAKLVTMTTTSALLVPCCTSDTSSATTSVTARDMPSTVPLTLTEPPPPESVDVDPLHAAMRAAPAHATPTTRLRAALSLIPRG